MAGLENGGGSDDSEENLNEDAALEEGESPDRDDENLENGDSDDRSGGLDGENQDDSESDDADELEPDSQYAILDPETGERRVLTGKEIGGEMMFKSRYDQSIKANQDELASLQKESEEYHAQSEEWQNDPSGFVSEHFNEMFEAAGAEGSDVSLNDIVDLIHSQVHKVRLLGHDIQLMYAKPGDEEYDAYVPTVPAKSASNKKESRELATLRKEKAEREVVDAEAKRMETFEAQKAVVAEKCGSKLTPGIQAAMLKLRKASDDKDWDYEKVLTETFGIKVAKRVPEKSGDNGSKGGRKLPGKPGSAEPSTPAQRARKKMKLPYQ